MRNYTIFRYFKLKFRALLYQFICFFKHRISIFLCHFYALLIYTRLKRVVLILFDIFSIKF